MGDTVDGNKVDWVILSGILKQGHVALVQCMAVESLRPEGRGSRRILGMPRLLQLGVMYQAIALAILEN